VQLKLHEFKITNSKHTRLFHNFTSKKSSKLPLKATEKFKNLSFNLLCCHARKKTRFFRFSFSVFFENCWLQSNAIKCNQKQSKKNDFCKKTIFVFLRFLRFFCVFEVFVVFCGCGFSWFLKQGGRV